MVCKPSGSILPIHDPSFSAFASNFELHVDPSMNHDIRRVLWAMMSPAPIQKDEMLIHMLWTVIQISAGTVGIIGSNHIRHLTKR